MKDFIKFLKSYPLVEVYREKKKKVHAPNVKDQMCCPFCGEPLVRDGEARMETLSEHVYSPNEEPSLKPLYRCMNEKCDFRKLYHWNGGLLEAGGAYIDYKNITYKDENGDLKMYDWAEELYQKSKDYYTSATNTFQMKMDIEHGMFNTAYILHPLFTFGMYRIRFEVQKVGSEDGRVVKRYITRSLLAKDEGRKDSGYCIVHQTAFHMFKFSIKQRRKKLKWFKEKQGKKYIVYTNPYLISKDELKRKQDELIGIFGNDSLVPRNTFKKWDWWRTYSEKWTRFWHGKTFKKYMYEVRMNCNALYGEVEGPEMYNEFEYKLFNK